MARFLTPARISTLILIELYSKADFWTYSPATSTTFLEIIAEQCLSTRVDGIGLDAQRVSLQDEHVLNFADRLSRLDSYFPGRSWQSVFLRALWEVTSLDEMHNVFERCSLLLVPVSSTDPPGVDQPKAAGITRASPIGQFVRRCNVEFTRLQYADSMALWKAFVAYREPSRDPWTQHYPDAAKALADHERQGIGLLGSTSTVSDSISFASADGVEALLSSSIAQLQKLGQRIPGDLKAKIEHWLVGQRTLNLQSLHHFMNFFESWRPGQYNLALENLHRYFDYSVAKGAGDNMKAYYQYALLHLSVLHADFERWDESMSAMEECIATARENQDITCLNFALSWLMYLRQSRNVIDASGLRSLAAIAGEGGTEQDELAFLKAKAKDSKHWTLMSSTLLEEARFEMHHHGVSAKALEHVLQSSYLNVQHASFSLMAATTIFQAAIFDRLGQPHLSRRLHESALSVHSTHCSLGDRARITSRLAYESAQRGQYSVALARLEELSSAVKGTLKLEQRVIAFAKIVALMVTVRRADLDAAQHHLANLLPMREYADQDVVGLINRMEIELLTKQNRLDLALSRINGLIVSAKTNADGDIAETLSFLVLKAKVFASAGRLPKGFSIAVRVAATAERSHLATPLMEALAALAGILNDLSEFEASRKLAEATLPQALEGSDSLLVAQSFVVLGEAYVGLAGQDRDASKIQQTRLLHNAAAYIERGREMYRRIDEYNGQLDCLLMKSRLARWSGDEVTAEHADGMYFQLMGDHDKQER